MPHRFQITVQPLDQDGAIVDATPLSFAVAHHDDLVEIVRKTSALKTVPDTEATEFAVGLKLFTEVLLRHRKEPLFEELWPHMGDFMKNLKAGVRSSEPSENRPAAKNMPFPK